MRPEDPSGPDGLVLTASALPVATALALVAEEVSPLGRLLDLFSVWIHEFGHATVAWLAGRAATPIACGHVGWTTTADRSSGIVFVCFAFLLAAIAYRGYRTRSWSWLTLGGLLLIAQPLMTFGLSQSQYMLLLSFGGQGGELYLSTLMAALFHSRFPPAMRWDLARYPALLIGVYTFQHNWRRWLKISRGRGAIRWGSWQNAHTGGDMSHLRDVHHWSPRKIGRTYAAIGTVCLAVLVINYLLRLVIAALRRPAAEMTD